ncbi:MAG: M23 family metallopeptidase [Bacteroidetes bacterium]|nr:MAG: M23 family metallopeptidase [Bacteroidota bacterium]
MFFLRIFFTSILLFSALNEIPKDKSIFISPVKIPLQLSANFGELRIDHFHSGLDIKTQGVTGKEVIATANGYIYRISVSPGGFGKALYIRHPSGYSTVYGHLDKFTPEIEEYVTDQQYEKQSFLVTLFPPKEKFPVSQGDLIAYSGNSGNSAGPHLHYEIRKSDSEIPVNPLLFEFGTGDNIEPVIEKLVIYPINHNTLINNGNSIRKINVAGGHGNYYIPDENEINISGLAGFGLKSFDLLNDSYNKCAVYSIELAIDSVPIFKYVMDAFSFNESRYINSHIDYETYMKENIYIERAFILPNDRLSVYKNVVNRGIINFNDDKIHHAEIIVKDVRNNKSTLSFNVLSHTTKPDIEPTPIDKNLKIMPFNKSNRFEAENISVSIPAGALYDTLYFSYKCTPGTKDMLSDVHLIHNIFTPVQKAYTVSIRPRIIPKGKESKMLIVQWLDDQKQNALNSTWSDGYLTAEALNFGQYYIGIDTIAPYISANGLVSGAILTGKNELKIKITDELSGIKSYEPTIDGKWALFEYDQKNNVLIYRFDEKRIIPDTKHNLSLKVTDNKDNTSFFYCDFTW